MNNPEDVRQVIVMRSKFPDKNGNLSKIRTGKMVAQGSHASIAFLTHKIFSDNNPTESGLNNYNLNLSEEEIAWIKGKFTKICVGVDSEEELLKVAENAKEAGLNVHVITDAGLTEFNGVPTKTCLAIGPHEKSKLDPITGHLKLL